MYQLNETKTVITVNPNFVAELAWVQKAAKRDNKKFEIMRYWHIMPAYIEACDMFRIHRLMHTPVNTTQSQVLLVNPDKSGLPAPLKKIAAPYFCTLWNRDEVYPDTDYFISKYQNSKLSITVDRNSLEWALSMGGKKKPGVVKLQANATGISIIYGSVTVTCHSIKPEETDTQITIGVDPQFLLDAVSIPTEVVTLGFTTNDAITIKSKMFFAVVMHKQLPNTKSQDYDPEPF